MRGHYCGIENRYEPWLPLPLFSCNVAGRDHNIA